MATISAPKMAAPAPPQKKAPKPPSKAKPPPKRNGNNSTIATHKAIATQPSSAELAKNAASSASAAAKIAFKSFGSKVKRDVQSLATGADSDMKSSSNASSSSSTLKAKRSPHAKSRSGGNLSGLFGGKLKFEKNNSDNNNSNSARSRAATTAKNSPNKKAAPAASSSQLPRQAPKLPNAGKHQKSQSDLREKNLKPSMLKNAKSKKPKPPPPKSKPASPIESAPFRKRSASHDDVDDKKAPPKKMQFNFFSKTKTKSKTNDHDKAHEKPKLPPRPRDMTTLPQSQKQQQQQTAAVALKPATKTSAVAAAASPPMAVAPPSYDVTSVNQKVAKPRDYHELELKPVDAMELRRKQKMQGVGRLGARTVSKTENRPTSATNLEQKEAPPTTATKKTAAASKPALVPPPVPADSIPKKKPKPALPSAPPPKPKPKSIAKRGVIAAMPTTATEGWIYTDQGMYGIASTRERELRNKGLFEGAPVLFDADGKQSVNIRVCEKMDESVVKECMDQKGVKTKHSAKFFIHGSLFEFAGDLSTNSFSVPNDCSAKTLSETHEKIVNALLNTNGGVIYMGIDETWNIKGVPARDINLSQIRQSMTQMVQSFSPKIGASDLQQLKFETIALLTKNGQLNKDLLVVRISIPGPICSCDDKNQPILVATKKGLKFKKNLNYIMKVVM